MYKWEINGKNDTLILFRRFLKSIYRLHTIDRKIIPTSEMVQKTPCKRKASLSSAFRLAGRLLRYIAVFPFPLFRWGYTFRRDVISVPSSKLALPLRFS